MKLGIDSVPLAQLREALDFAVANGWRQPAAEAFEGNEEPTAKIPVRVVRKLRREARAA